MTITKNQRKKQASSGNRLSPYQRYYLIFIGIAVVVPFVPVIIRAFSFSWFWPSILPTKWWWEARENAWQPLGWDYIFSGPSHVGEAIINTVFIAIVVTIVCTAISLPAARVIAWEKFRGKSAVEFFLLTPLIVADIAIGLGILITFLQLGLTGGYVGIILAHLIPTTPYMVRVLTSVFQGLSRDYEEQARLLGATPLKTLWFITMPMILPGIMAGGLFAFLISTNIFLLTFFVGQGNIVTLPTMLFAKVIGGSSLDTIGAEVALILSLPGLILLIITERFLKEEIFAKGFGG
ncbi:MAG: ABC transporter permease [Acidiferrobacteraceae bacterium]|nr:ABC transporter permease [Acidiferrobacteraceae bacterium]|tara:strand:- start:410 stop:1288 length:879 start_codon:yes stop_codon:yes gene_type:complete